MTLCPATPRFGEKCRPGGRDLFTEATAWIEGDQVLVQSETIAAPVCVRYLFRKPEPNAEVSLINAEGLPASSFMTDDFKPERTGDLNPTENR